MECLGLHNKPKAEVHPGHKLTGPKKEEEEEKKWLMRLWVFYILLLAETNLRYFGIIM
jgi:hypothetical protein